MSKVLRYQLIHPAIYVVLEHSYASAVSGQMVDARFHGVYTRREEAEGKVKKLKKIAEKTSVGHGYFCILKKPIEGSGITRG